MIQKIKDFIFGVKQREVLEPKVIMLKIFMQDETQLVPSYCFAQPTVSEATIETLTEGKRQIEEEIARRDKIANLSENERTMALNIGVSEEAWQTSKDALQEKEMERQVREDLDAQWKENCKTDPSLNDPLNAREIEFGCIFNLTENEVKARRVLPAFLLEITLGKEPYGMCDGCSLICTYEQMDLLKPKNGLYICNDCVAKNTVLDQSIKATGFEPCNNIGVGVRQFTQGVATSSKRTVRKSVQFDKVKQVLPKVQLHEATREPLRHLELHEKVFGSDAPPPPKEWEEVYKNNKPPRSSRRKSHAREADMHNKKKKK